jgi:hypothetical protein
LWVVLFWGGLGVWGLFCAGWPKKCWMARRGVACVSDMQDSFSYVDLDLAPGVSMKKRLIRVSLSLFRVSLQELND